MLFIMRKGLILSSPKEIPSKESRGGRPNTRFKRRFIAIVALPVLAGVSYGQNLPIRNHDGLRMTVDAEDHDPAIHVVLPGGPEKERSFNILLPEHVTLREHGQIDAKHFYIWKPGNEEETPQWRQEGNSLEYTREFGKILFKAKATLESDGILFNYKFVNHSPVDYDMVWAVTDPRFKTFFYDPRLERTYVHHKDGFDLLASETPARLTLPLNQWLPARYHAQFSIPIPDERVQHRSDGISYYYKSRTVDIPLIATLSADRQ